MAELTAILDRLAGRLGTVGGEPVPLDGGITNRNFRVRFGERDCVLRLPGRDTELLGIDRGAERMASERAAALGIAPPLVAADEECLVTEWLAGAPIDGDRLRRRPRRARLGPCAPSTTPVCELPVRFWVPDLLGDYARDRRRARRRAARQLPPRRRRLVDRIAAVLPLTDPVPCHNDLLPGNILAADADAEPGGARRLGVRRDGSPAVSTSATWPSTTSLTRPLKTGCWRPTSASRRRPGAGRPAADDARLRRPRGGLGGRPGRRSPSWTSTSPTTPTQHFARLERGADDPRLEEWLEWRDRVSSPTAPGW